MSMRRNQDFSSKVKPSNSQPNHVFIICGPGAHERAALLYEKGQCQPAIPVPENISPDLCDWDVKGKDVTICNLGSPDNFTEDLVYALLKDGATLVVNADQSTGHVTVYRPEELSNVA